MITDEAGNQVPFTDLVLNWLNDLGTNLWSGKLTQNQQDMIVQQSGPAAITLHPTDVVPGTGQTVQDLKNLGYTNADLITMISSWPSVMASDNSIGTVIAQNNAAADENSLTNRAAGALASGYQTVADAVMPSLPTISGLTSDQSKLLVTVGMVVILMIVVLLIFHK